MTRSLIPLCEAIDSTTEAMLLAAREKNWPAVLALISRCSGILGDVESMLAAHERRLCDLVELGSLVLECAHGVGRKTAVPRETWSETRPLDFGDEDGGMPNGGHGLH